LPFLCGSTISASLTVYKYGILVCRIKSTGIIELIASGIIDLLPPIYLVHFSQQGGRTFRRRNYLKKARNISKYLEKIDSKLGMKENLDGRKPKKSECYRGR